MIREDADGTNLAQLTAMNESHRILPVRIATLPLAYLDDAIVLFCGTYHNITFLYTIAERLFAIDILASLASGNHQEAMPMVWRTDDNHIDILAID